MDILELESKTISELRKIAEDLNFPKPIRLKREGLIVKIAQALGEQEGLEIRGGVLEIMNEGIGFLRPYYRIGPDDIYVSRHNYAAMTCALAISSLGMCALLESPKDTTGYSK